MTVIYPRENKMYSK